MIPYSFVLATLVTLPAMAIDLTPLWDFNKPAISEERFQNAIKTASPDDALILQTQIARTYGLRRDFAKAQELLKKLEPQLVNASAEARVMYFIELGRTFSSAKHSAESQTTETKEQARKAFTQAFQLAKNERLDALAIDALHMQAFVDTSALDQLKWANEALAVVQASSQPAAKKWEASLRNNAGYALHQLGRYTEALAEFQRAVVLHKAGKDAQALRIAYWMEAWTLRALKRVDEAINIQLRLERECAAAGEPDSYVFEELELLYRLKGDEPKAVLYAEKKKALAK
ncbi:MAG: tetratricopeptide repeat protein [Burkholderiales bacterium]|nr:tetratricopeptide repeat protein [Burkholderiales bacterium]